MTKVVVKKEELIPVYIGEKTTFCLWDRGYIIGEFEHLSETDIGIVKEIMNPTSKIPIKFETWTLKPTSFIHSEVFKKAIHVIRIEDLPSYGKVPEGYFFISNHPIVFDAHYYDAERWREIRNNQWKIRILIKDTDDKNPEKWENQWKIYEHWKIYLYFPAHHLYEHSPAMAIDYSIIPIPTEDITKENIIKLDTTQHLNKIKETKNEEKEKNE